MTQVLSAQPAQAFSDNQIKLVPSRNQFFLILFAYFSVQLVTRCLISETIGIDEADQVVLGQKWAWGYGPQPPLYTWLMRLFLGGFGYSVFSLTLLRELLLFGIYLLGYFNGRQITGSHVGGIVAAVAVQFNPSISWESQRELTHSIVASLMLLAAVLAFLRLQPGRSSQYVALGVFGALATLSKYNAALFYAALLIAAVSLPSLRPRVLHWRMAMAIAISLAVLAPNLYWAMTHQKLAFASMYKFGIDESIPWTKAVRAGLWQWVSKSFAHVAPTMVAFLAIFWRPVLGRTQEPGDGREEMRAAASLLLRTFLLIVLMAVLSVLIFKVTSFKDRWLQPLFVPLPLLFVAWLHPYLNSARLRAVLVLGALVGILVTVIAPGRMLITDWQDQQRSRKHRPEKREVLNAPFRKLAPDIATQVQGCDFLVTDNRWLTANLHLWFPEKLALTPDLVPYYPTAGRSCLVIWEVGKTEVPPLNLRTFAQEFSGKETLGQPLFVEEVWKYHRSKKIRFALAMIRKAE